MCQSLFVVSNQVLVIQYSYFLIYIAVSNLVIINITLQRLVLVWVLVKQQHPKKKSSSHVMVNNSCLSGRVFIYIDNQIVCQFYLPFCDNLFCVFLFILSSQCIPDAGIGFIMEAISTFRLNTDFAIESGSHSEGSPMTDLLVKVFNNDWKQPGK